LWPGNFFDKEVATALLKDNSAALSIWKEIPVWRAGRWRTEQSTRTRTIKYIQGEPVEVQPLGVYTSKNVSTSGWQRDRNGDIWELYASNFWTLTESDTFNCFSFIKHTSPGRNDYPDGYSASVDFYVDKNTGKITTVVQTVSWSRSSYIAPGVIKEETYATAYGKTGEPLITAWSTNIAKRYEPFYLYASSCDFENHSHQWIHRDFVNYLKNNGLANLIPLDEEKPSEEEIASLSNKELVGFKQLSRKISNTNRRL
jgi:hypothetical protein